MYPQWYPTPMPMQPPHGQHQPPPPGPHMSPHPSMPMSPRNPPSSLQGPGTPTLSHAHALPNPVHAPHPPPALSHASNSIGGLTSPPPTPSSTSIPRLNAGSNTFVPRQKVTLKKEDGTEVNLDNIAKSSPVPAAPATAATPPGSVYRQGTLGTPNRGPANIRIESEDQRKARLADEEAKEKERQRVKAAAEEKIRKEKEEAERKVREAEEKKRAEEEAEKERIRKEEEAKAEAERAKLEAERLRKEAEELAARKAREEEERKAKEAEELKAKLAAEEKAKKEEEERLEKERIEKEKAAEEERLAKEAEAERLRIEQEEAAKKAAAAVPESSESSKETSEDGEVEEGQVIELPAAKEEPKERVKDNLRINTATSPVTDRKQRPGPLDLSIAKTVSVTGTPIPGPLATARIIADISSVQYPEGVSSPRPELNENAKEGKFR